jgi:hypothetical protein
MDGAHCQEEAAMPLTIGDVLNTLGDPVAQGMDFWAGPVHISGRSYGIIRDHVRIENILVVPGTSNLATYDGKTDILTTQKDNPPADLDARALLLHECTHALVDVFTGGLNVTRHTGELASYLAQHVYLMRSNPAWAVAPNNVPWFNFYSSVVALIKTHRLETVAGNGARIKMDELEPLRLQLVALPGVPYGSYPKEELARADGLLRNHPFLDDMPEEITVHYQITAHETYPDPSDDYLIRTLLEQYRASDVAGYGKRLRELRRDFALCSLGRAKQLIPRLAVRKAGDRVSELFYDRLSAGGRAILMRVLRSRK